jgi:uncharacterized membrane protein YraQ (UPF0718 family)
MTLIRPVSSLITATVAGLMINQLPDDSESKSAEPEKAVGCG